MIISEQEMVALLTLKEDIKSIVKCNALPFLNEVLTKHLNAYEEAKDEH